MARSRRGQRTRAALLLGAVVALISGAVLVGSSAQAAAGLCSSAPYMSGSRTIAVDPCQGLNDQQDVTITGHGFTPDGDVTIFMCKASPASSDDCDSSNTGAPTADANGEINDTFTVLKTFTTDGGEDITCNNGSPSPNCSVLATDGDDATVPGAFEDVGFGAAATTTTTAASSTTTTTTGGSTTTTTGGSTTTSTTTGSTTTTTSAAATCPTGGTTSSPSVTVSPLQATPGSNVTVAASGLPKNTDVDIDLCSSPVLLVRVTTDGNGNLPATVVTIPATASVGTHQIVVQPVSGSGQAGVASLTLVASSVQPTPAATATEATPSFVG